MSVSVQGLVQERTHLFQGQLLFFDLKAKEDDDNNVVLISVFCFR